MKELQCSSELNWRESISLLAIVKGKYNYLQQRDHESTVG